MVLWRLLHALQHRCHQRHARSYPPCLPCHPVWTPQMPPRAATDKRAHHVPVVKTALESTVSHVLVKPSGAFLQLSA